MGENKRKARRIPVAWMLDLTTRAGDKIRSRIVNISQTGILFMSPHRFYANELMGMVIVVRDTCQIRCVGRIVRELPGSSRFATYAAEFIRFSEDGQDLLKDTLAQVLKRLPEEKAPPPPAAEVPAAPEATDPTSPATERDWGPRHDAGPIVIRR